MFALLRLLISIVGPKALSKVGGGLVEHVKGGAMPTTRRPAGKGVFAPHWQSSRRHDNTGPELAESDTALIKSAEEAAGGNVSASTGCCCIFGDERPLDLFVKSGYEDQDGFEYSDGTLSNLEKNVWESRPQPILIDSGASTSVLPLKWCTHVRTKETEASRRGEHYTAANGGEIYNKGEKAVTMVSREGPLRNMKFTSYDAERVL